MKYFSRDFASWITYILFRERNTFVANDGESSITMFEGVASVDTAKSPTFLEMFCVLKIVFLHLETSLNGGFGNSNSG